MGPVPVTEPIRQFGSPETNCGLGKPVRAEPIRLPAVRNGQGVCTDEDL